MNLHDKSLFHPEVDHIQPDGTGGMFAAETETDERHLESGNIVFQRVLLQLGIQIECYEVVAMHF
jgi:hypothetical protein